MSAKTDLQDLPKLYTELADWFTAVTAPEEYSEEAAFYRRALVSACEREPGTVLELGSGGGNNASHLKQHWEMTLVDLSPAMLEVSRKLNPECEHSEGDMRSVRLGRVFDAVFVHDAIDYMRTLDDARRAIETAWVHCAPGGGALFAPDYTTETFRPNTSHGGHDRGDRSLRYLEWEWLTERADGTYTSLMVYVMRERDGSIRCVEDRHHCGLFSRHDWLRLIEEAGFEPRSLPLEHSEVEPGTCEVFLGSKPRETRP